MTEKESYYFNSYEEFDESKFSPSDDDSDIQAWEEAGRPHFWVKAEEKGAYTVYVDLAYGGMRLYYNGRLLDEVHGSHFIGGIPGHPVVVLDKDYYNVHKYLWS